MYLRDSTIQDIITKDTLREVNLQWTFFQPHQEVVEVMKQKPRCFQEACCLSSEGKDPCKLSTL
jgi:hypothetical protein